MPQSCLNAIIFHVNDDQPWTREPIVVWLKAVGA
jgi:hypothetical protein